MEPDQPSTGADAEIAAILDDARVRAQVILQESMEQVAALLAQRSDPGDAATASDVAALQHQLDRVTTDVREIREWLARLESRIPVAGAPQPLFIPDRMEQPPETGSEPPADRPPALSLVRPEPTWAETPDMDRAPRILATDDTGPPSAVTPPPAPPLPRLRPNPPDSPPDPRPTPLPALVRSAPGPDIGAGAFDSGGGPVLLRISPVAGFQGLMRVQDALGRVQTVRQATVEAYAQGEARLRVELSGPTTPAALATDLAAGLQQSTQVRQASPNDRSMMILLG